MWREGRQGCRTEPRTGCVYLRRVSDTRGSDGGPTRLRAPAVLGSLAYGPSQVLGVAPGGNRTPRRGPWARPPSPRPPSRPGGRGLAGGGGDGEGPGGSRRGEGPEAVRPAPRKQSFWPAGVPSGALRVAGPRSKGSFKAASGASSPRRVPPDASRAYPPATRPTEVGRHPWLKLLPGTRAAPTPRLGPCRRRPPQPHLAAAARPACAVNASPPGPLGRPPPAACER